MYIAAAIVAAALVRLLTSEEALRDGVGHVCKLREKEEADARRWEEENQYSLLPPPEQ